MYRPTEQELCEFVYKEADLLDSQDFDSWLHLFTEDAVYWMPLGLDQQDPKLHSSLMYEDKLLLQIRVERLANRRTYSQNPRSRCHHLLQRPKVELVDHDAAAYRLRTAFHYVETRHDDQALYAGWATHHLTREDNALRIRLKRVDLLNCDAALGSIQLFM